MKILTILFFAAVYYLVKRVLETMVEDERARPVDNSKITYDVVKGIPLSERKLRLSSGYYYKS